MRISDWSSDVCSSDLEGGYSNHPADRGGPTHFGITQAVARANGHGGDMRAMPRTVAEAIYRRLYCERPGFAFVAELEPAVAEELVDTAVDNWPAIGGGFFQGALDAIKRHWGVVPHLKVDK